MAHLLKLYNMFQEYVSDTDSSYNGDNSSIDDSEHDEHWLPNKVKAKKRGRPSKCKMKGNMKYLVTFIFYDIANLIFQDSGLRKPNIAFACNNGHLRTNHGVWC